MEMMAWSLTNEERAQVRDAFIELDSDRSGAISLSEFKKVLEDKYHLDDASAKEAFEALDINHDDEIHYADFLAAVTSSRINLHDDLLKATFKRFDTENQGFIDVESLRKVLGEAFEGEDIEEMLQEAGPHDGKLTLEEFMAYLRVGDHEFPEKHQTASRIIDKEMSQLQRQEERKPKMKPKPSAKSEEPPEKKDSYCGICAPQ